MHEKYFGVNWLA